MGKEIMGEGALALAVVQLKDRVGFVSVVSAWICERFIFSREISLQTRVQLDFYESKTEKRKQLLSAKRLSSEFVC